MDNFLFAMQYKGFIITVICACLIGISITSAADSPKAKIYLPAIYNRIHSVPEVVYRTPFSDVGDFKIVNDRIYMIQGGALQIRNFSPVGVSTDVVAQIDKNNTPIFGDGKWLDIKDTHLYVGTSTGFYIINLKEDSLKIEGSLSSTITDTIDFSSFFSMKIDGSRGYYDSIQSPVPGVVIFNQLLLDLANPSAPTVVSHINEITQNGANHPEPFLNTGMVIRSNIRYGTKNQAMSEISSPALTSFFISDMTTYSSTQELASIPLKIEPNYGASLAKNGDYIFVTAVSPTLTLNDTLTTRLIAIDVKQITNPFLVGSVNGDFTHTNANISAQYVPLASDIVINDGVLYFCDYTSNRIQLFDIKDPAHLSYMRSVQLPVEIKTASRFSIDGDLAYLIGAAIENNETSSYFWIVKLNLNG